MLALDRMDSTEIGRYLASRGLLPENASPTVEPLGGGVSNIVLRVATPTQCMVLKQALPELRVEAYWPSRIDRALREAAALRVVADYLPGGVVPEVFFSDEENFIYGMACAPPTATLWKEDLLAGRVDVPVGAAAGRVLAQMHAIQEPDVERRFIDDEVFWQLRVDPYYITTAEKHPSLRPVFDHAIAQMKARKLALVHGDYSPKNMFVVNGKMAARAERCAEHESYAYESGEPKMDSRESGNDGVGAQSDSLAGEDNGDCANHILLLDFEVVHWGDPAFDLAFCINHLLIKSIVNSNVQKEYFQSVAALLAGYRATLPDLNWEELKTETRLQLGCLMLARIDGKSPVEYITDEPTKETVRRVSRFILEERPAGFDDIYACIARETGRLCS